MPLPDALAHIFLVVFNCQVIQFGLRLEIAYTEIDAAMLETVAENGDQPVLGHGVFKGLIELAYRVDGAHPFETSPRHGLGAFYKVCQRYDVQIHSAAFLTAQSRIRCLRPSAFLRDEVGLDEFLKCFFAFVHGSYHLSLSCYNGFVERYEKAKVQLEQLRTTKAARENQAEAIGAFMFEVQELGILIEFDEKLWLTVIDTVTVHADGRMTFKFQGGTEIEG